MAVDFVNELTEMRTSSIDAAFVRRYTRVFRIRMKKVDDGPRGARLALLNKEGVGIGQIYPPLGDTPADPLAPCVDIDVQPDSTDHRHTFEATVQYDSSDPILYPDPLTRPPKFSRQPLYGTEPVRRDVYGNPILNSAKLEFDPPVEREVNKSVILITKNMPTGGTFPIPYSDELADTYENAINNDVWRNYNPGQARLRGMPAEEVYEHGIYYWQVRFEVVIDLDGWARKVLDAGMTQIVDGKHEACMVKQGLYNEQGQRTGEQVVPTAEPLMLNSNGTQMLPAADGEIQPAHYPVFDVYNYQPFIGLIPERR